MLNFGRSKRKAERADSGTLLHRSLEMLRTARLEVERLRIENHKLRQELEQLQKMVGVFRADPTEKDPLLAAEKVRF